MEKGNQAFKTEFKRRLYQFTLNVIGFIDSLPKDNTSRRIGDQLLRSSTSIVANYVEGQAGSSRRDFVNFMQYALKSSNETKLWLSLLKDSGRAEPERVSPLLNEAVEIAKILGAVVISAKASRKR